MLKSFRKSHTKIIDLSPSNWPTQEVQAYTHDHVLYNPSDSIGWKLRNLWHDWTKGEQVCLDSSSEYQNIFFLRFDNQTLFEVNR